MMLDHMLCCVSWALTLVAMQLSARMDLESILANPKLFPRSQKCGLELVIFTRPKLDTMHCKV